jgi:hypothetical protein
MKKISVTLLGICMMLAAFTLKAQITQEQLTLDAPNVVNFTQLAAHDLAFPPAKIQRAIEQGEDIEEDFHFTPKEVSSSAYNYTLPASHQLKALANSPAPATSFNGVMDNSTLIPPDIRCAAGPNHVMQTTNQEFKIFNKSGSLLSTVAITTFFSASGGSGYFDPHVLYDNTNGRWLVCIDGNVSNGHGGLFLAVSQTNDPTGSWYVYSFDAVGTTTDFIDYPLLGYNTNWVVITANDFTSNTTAVGKVYVFNRASVYSGSAGTISTFTDNNAFTLAPAQTFDASQTTLYMVQDWNGNSGGNGYVQICTVTGTASAPVYTAGAQLGINQPWSETTVGAKQSGSTKTFDNGDTRIGNAVYVNGSLWFAQTGFLPASSPTRSSVQWWQVNPSVPSVQQFGRIDDATTGTFYFYPSIAVNSSGDAVISYSQSSSTTFASASYAVHASTDAASSTQTGYVYKAGVANYYKTYGGTRNRWGDYTGAALDPSDNSFWVTSEWANTGNLWATAVAHVSVTATPVCNAATGMSTTNVANNTATFNWTAVTGAGSYNVQYRAVGSATWSTGTATTNLYNATGLTAGTNYEWQVQTVCTAGGTSSYTASTTFTTTGTAPCNAPTGLATSAITSTTATFSWTAATGASSYNVQYRVVGVSTWTTGSTTTTSFNVTGLTAATNYEWQVQTVCASGSSAFTASATFTSGAACSDVYEPNESRTAAKTIATNTDITGMISSTTDNDYFKFTTTSPNTNIQITLTNLPADYDVRLYNSSGTQLAISQNTGTTSELIKRNTTTAATYYVRVYGYSGAYSTTSCYKLRVSVASTAFAPVLASPEQQAKEIVDNTDVKLYPNPAKDNVTVEFISKVESKVRMNVYNLAGQRIISNETTSAEGLNVQSINTNTLSNGVYVFEIENNGSVIRQKFTIAK